MPCLFFKVDKFILIFDLGEMIYNIAVISVTAFICDMTANSVNNMKSMINKQHMQCSDESLRHELETTLEYVKRRQFPFNIRSFTTMDMSLPIRILTTSITYTIVVIQFVNFKL
uniref:Antennal gustatory receptor 5 n=1 Tax=Dendrolimus punctatus TaxID=238572 RepID=A0A2K8GKW6_9NEOP|nr:antennal gustatory receptor 5 [Dendrolimus punctatus]